MKRVSIAIFLLLLALPLAAKSNRTDIPKAPSKRAGFRLMCYNVRNCKGADDEVSYERVASIIRSARPEVVAIQELDSMTTRYPGQYVLGNLAELTGMKATFCHSIEYRGGRYGVGLLSRTKPLSVRREPLPCPREPRVVLIAEFEDYYVLVTHWSLKADYRTRTANILNGIVKTLKPKPVLLCGDFNARPYEESMAVLAKGFKVLKKEGSNLTFPAWEPRYEIDYICVGLDAADCVTVRNHLVLNEPDASDHRPFIADIKIDK